MGFYALIKDNRVTSVIVAEPEFIEQTPLSVLQADCVIDVSNVEFRPGPGFTYDAETMTFTTPA